MIVDSLYVLQGATIKKDERSGAIIVARIMRGGAADRSGEHWCASSLSTQMYTNSTQMFSLFTQSLRWFITLNKLWSLYFSCYPLFFVASRPDTCWRRAERSQRYPCRWQKTWRNNLHPGMCAFVKRQRDIPLTACLMVCNITDYCEKAIFIQCKLFWSLMSKIIC